MNACKSHRMSRLGAASLLMAALLPMAMIPPSSAAASSSSAAAQCDAAAGSEHDLQRNLMVKPVSTDDIQIGIALSACREAYKFERSPRITFQLARVLHKAGRKQDSLKLLEEASDQGYAAAMVNFGVLLAERGDTGQEFALMQRAAAAGNILAAYNLGVAYRDGTGTAADGPMAVKWFGRASLARDAVATFNLAVIHDEGKLVPEDNEKAARLYRQAAEAGNIDAMVNLGLMLEDGEGVSKDLSGALELYQRAADLGDGFAAKKTSRLKPVDIGGNDTADASDAG